MPYNVRGFWFGWQKCPECKKWLPDIQDILVHHYELMHQSYTPFDKPMPKTKSFNMGIENYIVMPSLEQKYPDTLRISDIVKVGEQFSITEISEVQETEKNQFPCRTLKVKGQTKPIFILEAGIMKQLESVTGTVSEKEPLRVILAEYPNKVNGEMSLTIKNV